MGEPKNKCGMSEENFEEMMKHAKEAPAVVIIAAYPDKQLKVASFEGDPRLLNDLVYGLQKLSNQLVNLDTRGGERGISLESILNPN